MRIEGTADLLSSLSERFDPRAAAHPKRLHGAVFAARALRGGRRIHDVIIAAYAVSDMGID